MSSVLHIPWDSLSIGVLHSRGKDNNHGSRQASWFCIPFVPCNCERLILWKYNRMLQLFLLLLEFRWPFICSEHPHSTPRIKFGKVVVSWRKHMWLPTLPGLKKKAKVIQGDCHLKQDTDLTSLNSVLCTYSEVTFQCSVYLAKVCTKYSWCKPYFRIAAGW